jgi:hypothetical protein
MNASLSVDHFQSSDGATANSLKSDDCKWSTDKGALNDFLRNLYFHFVCMFVTEEILYTAVSDQGS